LDKKSVADALRLLAEDNAARTELAKLKDHLDSIDAALSAGVNRTKIYYALCECGLNMTKGSFFNALRKLLQERNNLAQQIKNISEDDINAETINDEYSALTRKERGLNVAQKYINDEKMSPLTLRVLEKEQRRKQQLEKDNENSSD
jgi:hemerythrin-like domain-containing protein